MITEQNTMPELSQIERGENTMPSFLNDVSAFYGTGERNRAGQTLEEFLESYDPYKYKNPSCTTDAVVFSANGKVDEELTGLKILLVKRSNHPSIGFWALPGGFVELRENLEDTARRELEEETGVKGLPVEQFACFGDYDRDPRARVITAAYMSLVDEGSVRVCAGDDAADAAWFEAELSMSDNTADEEWNVTEYRLQIRNEEIGVFTEALVEKRERKGLVRERKYIVRERGMIAVDHAAIIVQAMEILKRRVRHSGM